MAKPKLEKDRLTNIVSCRLSTTEYEGLQKKIEQSGMTESKFLRECVLKNQTTVVVSDERVKQNLQYIYNKAGNNINQIAHSLNYALKAGRVSKQVYEQTLRCLSDVEAYLKAGFNADKN